jgi:ribosomal protein S18 acetylase RimI-like enzyme
MVLTVYQGLNVYNKASQFFTTDKEWARQFTQSGQDSEIRIGKINPSVIYQKDPLPEATDEKQIDVALEEAKAAGYLAIWINEGRNEPPGILVIDMKAVKIHKQSMIRESEDIKQLRDKAEEFRLSLLKKYPQLQELYFGIQVGNVLHISSIKVKLEDRHQGVGSNVIGEIKKFAKDHKLVITLSREPERGHKKNLERFYKGLGFVDNKGRNKDYRYASFFGSTMYHKPHINEGAMLIHQKDKAAISKYLKDMDIAVNKNYLAVKKPVDSGLLIAYMNQISNELPSNKFPFKIEYSFYGGKTDGFYADNKITIVVGSSCKYRIEYDNINSRMLFNVYSVDFKKMSSTFIHEFTHYIQDVYRKEKQGDYRIPDDWSDKERYYKRGWERQAHALGYLEKLRKEFGIRTSKDLLKHLQRSGLLQNPDLNKLKKTDFNSWKAIMKQAIMATSANI